MGRQRSISPPVSIVPAALMGAGYLAAAIASTGSEGPPPVERVAVLMLAGVTPGVAALIVRQVRGLLGRSDLFLCAIPLALMAGYIGSAQMAQAEIRENLRAHQCYLRQCAICDWTRDGKVPIDVRKRTILEMRTSGVFTPPSPHAPVSLKDRPALPACGLMVERNEIGCRIHGRPQILSVGSRSLTLPSSPPVRLCTDVL